MPSNESGDPTNYPTAITIPSDGDGPGIKAADVNVAFEGLADRTAWLRALAESIGIKVSVFTSSGTYVVPAGVTNVILIGYGGGGGGGAGSYGTSASLRAVGGGGGGGSLLSWGYAGVTPGNSEAVVIGAGGSGAAVQGGGTGNDGGVTSFGGTKFRACGGGAGWGDAWAGGAPGTAGAGPQAAGIFAALGGPPFSPFPAGLTELFMSPYFSGPSVNTPAGLVLYGGLSWGTSRAPSAGGAGRNWDAAGDSGNSSAQGYQGGVGGNCGATGSGRYGGGGGGGGGAGPGGQGANGGGGGLGSGVVSGSADGGTGGSAAANTGAGGGGGGGGGQTSGGGAFGGGGGNGGSGKLWVIAVRGT